MRGKGATTAPVRQPQKSVVLKDTQLPGFGSFETKIGQFKSGPVIISSCLNSIYTSGLNR